jgi:hypothetical protein
MTETPPVIVDDVGPVVAMSVAVAEQLRGDRRRGRQVVDQDVSGVFASGRTEGAEERGARHRQLSLFSMMKSMSPRSSMPDWHYPPDTEVLRMTVTERVHQSDRPTKREWPPIPRSRRHRHPDWGGDLDGRPRASGATDSDRRAIGLGRRSVLGGLDRGYDSRRPDRVEPPLVFSALVLVVAVLGSAISDPRAQTIGGAVLIIVSLVLLLLPSVRRYETKRIRVIIE